MRKGRRMIEEKEGEERADNRGKQFETRTGDRQMEGKRLERKRKGERNGEKTRTCKKNVMNGKETGNLRKGVEENRKTWQKCMKEKSEVDDRYKGRREKDDERIK